MTSIDQLADRYAAAWNETDAARRRAAIEALWVPGGEHVVRTQQVRGHDELERRVTASNEKNVQAAGYRFRSAGDAQQLHNTVMFHWHMEPADGSRIAALGLEFLVLAPDGRIAVDYQFILPTPAA